MLGVHPPKEGSLMMTCVPATVMLSERHFDALRLLSDRESKHEIRICQ